MTDNRLFLNAGVKCLELGIGNIHLLGKSE